MPCRVAGLWCDKKIVLTVCHAYRCGRMMPDWADLGRSRRMILITNCEQ